ncbi:hypothetical protein Z043_120776 [Scleropages formosus]|uniref:Neuroguidin-like n=1 Tax=Scleropages formosus TaxID=113540 RepID=A0A0P7UNE7_SCLFO|nr:hypothetical protein Z043_120776 [Scleropages formosus]
MLSNIKVSPEDLSSRTWGWSVVGTRGAVERDVPSAVSLLSSLTQQGLSFLDLRYQLLLFYLQDVTHLISLKAEGSSIKDSGALHRLVAVRTVLEKMRPLDQKMRYQVDKLVRTAVTGSLAANDPLQFRPNPENLISKLSESEESEDEGGAAAERSGSKAPPGASKKYIPPRIAPVHYEGDMTEADRQKEMADKRRRAALRSSVIQELRQQYSDAPEEIRDRRDFQTERESREELHRKQYEESMMVRLAVTRQEKSARKRGMKGMSSQLSSITRFSDITALTGGDEPEIDAIQPKKKKQLKKKKKRAFRVRR